MTLLSPWSLHSISLLLQTPGFVIVVVKLFLPHPTQDFIEMLVIITAYLRHKQLEKKISWEVYHM